MQDREDTTPTHTTDKEEDDEITCNLQPITRQTSIATCVVVAVLVAV